jgi:ParB-like chromosome segregation protein Spo0J
MKTIPLTEITIEDRLRATDKNHAQDLAESIRDEGLLQPIVLGRDKRLIAGGHRYAAYQILAEEDDKYKEIPYIYIEEHLEAQGLLAKGEALSEAKRAKLEVEENVKRLGLHWLDRARGVLRYHKLARKEALPQGDKWTMGQTGDALGLSQASISLMLNVVDDIDSGRYPQLAECSSLKEALRVKLAIKTEKVWNEQRKRSEEAKRQVVKKVEGTLDTPAPKTPEQDEQGEQAVSDDDLFGGADEYSRPHRQYDLTKPFWRDCLFNSLEHVNDRLRSSIFLESS